MSGGGISHPVASRRPLSHSQQARIQATCLRDRERDFAVQMGLPGVILLLAPATMKSRVIGTESIRWESSS